MTTEPAVLEAFDCDAPHDPSDHGRLDALQHEIEHAAHYLPAQGPITVFIHHNTLHAYEDYSFDEGVQRGAKLFGCEPYLPESRYREFLHSGRIRPADIEAVLLDDLGDAADVLLGFMGTRFHFRQAMLYFPLQSAPAAELEWFIAETDALRRFRSDAPDDIRRRFLEETKHWILRDHASGNYARPGSQNGDRPLHDVLVELIDHFGRSSLDRWSDAIWEQYSLQALWRICERGVRGVPLAATNEPRLVRLRDPVLTATGRDIDQLVNEELIRFCSAFLDQGLSRWPLPDRERGFWAAFAALHTQPGSLPDAWLANLPRELLRLEEMAYSPLEIIDESLTLLGVADDERQEYLIETLLALRGWAGMVHQVQTRGDRVAHPVPAGSLTEYLAVRLVLERLALAHVAREELGYAGPLDQLLTALPPVTCEPRGVSVDQRAFGVFQLAQVLGWLPPALAQLSPHEWATLIREIEAFSSVQRRRILHAAYERRYRNQTLDATAIHARQAARRVDSPVFQVVCCLDEREESFRRHLEEVQPRAETFGAAGFYGVAIYYRGAADAHYVPLCPVIIRPQHWVVESVPSHRADDHRRRAGARRTLGAASHWVHLGSRSALGGAVVTGGLGVLASIPLVARVLFPRLTAKLRSLAGRLVNPPLETILEIERTEPSPGPHPGQIGYSVDEMATIVERLLRDIGLATGFARLVFVFGHGSVSLNNPHESAHDCGACGGGRGGPNARAWARMANDPRIRTMLAAKGLPIPEDTVFIGGYHNTCDESLEVFDLDRVPASHASDLAAARRDLDEARAKSAHERCRRFESAPLSMTPDAALRHVQARAEDLAQVRPEYGHASNALCFVTRRSRTRGLYMDRRAFLTSYDPTSDDAQHTILTRLLSAAVPVCAGISLEYYFSYVDNVGYGCGTKLPHNITSLLGVMDGAGSDLRTGLPWQMVEIHEPVRVLFVIETTPAALTEIMDRHPGIGKLCKNGWVQVATLSPDSSQIHVLRGDRFVPYTPESTALPQVASSLEWYRGWRDHLGFAQITAQFNSPTRRAEA
jgi:uncharacterized protein YbcC (UPF0753/DUF2309 family)